MPGEELGRGKRPQAKTKAKEEYDRKMLAEQVQCEKRQRNKAIRAQEAELEAKEAAYEASKSKAAKSGSKSCSGATGGPKSSEPADDEEARNIKQVLIDE
ncbi:hypothetical protein FRC06_004969, partial [Ceratobasidium sp. 370]